MGGWDNLVTVSIHARAVNGLRGGVSAAVTTSKLGQSLDILAHSRAVALPRMEACAVVKDQHPIALEPRLDLANTIDIHERRSMHA